MLRVFITVDTEAWPLAETPQKLVQADYDRDYYGITPQGEFGALFQADLLRKHGLRGVFFVETLSSYVSGIQPLRQLVEELRKREHEVALHTHAEWCRRDPTLAGPSSGDLMRHYSEERQTTLIAKALQPLHACGIADVRSFRAGGYGANLDTLKALAKNNIRFDSSYNYCWLGQTCGIETDTPLMQPRVLEEVYEYPVTYFRDWPRHFRHAEICACSSAELEELLLRAHRCNWHSVVIVSHSFECIRRDRPSKPRPNWVVVRRFERLCQFLERHPDKFLSSTFHDEGLDGALAMDFSQPLAGSLRNTFCRGVEQVWKRIA